MDDQNTDDFQEFSAPESLGDYLKRHREASGKTLDSVARSTRIQKRFLQAFEDNDSARMPEEAFTRGFLRAYAMDIGLDVEEVIGRYERLKRASMPTQVREIKKPTPSLVELGADEMRRFIRIPSATWIVIGIVVLGVVTAAGLWSPKRSASNSGTVVESTPAESSEETIDRTLAPNALGSVTSGTSAVPAPVAPSTLSIRALRKAKVNVRLDDHPSEEIAMIEDETKVYNVFNQIEVKTSDRSAFQFQYNGKAVEAPGSTIKLFNRNLITTKKP